MSTSELEELLFYKDADTLAFIDPPSYRPAWLLKPNSAQSIGHRIHSVNLLTTGSPVFKQLFEPKAQERNIKRRGGLPEGIKYIIDLTPPSEEEDAVLLLAELSCPLGIRKWAKSRSRWDLPLSCVSGLDILSQSDGNDSDPLPEYSPSRHRAGIAHILQVLEGRSPQLNTPCKLWTFFAVAKLYEIATSPQINLMVASWVYEGNNKRLIELHPEVTYRLAKGIQCSYLMQDSFCVLVGEEALSILRKSSASTHTKQHRTVHGRTQGTLDDDDIQRVQYAGESFLDHIIEKFVELAGSEMRWLNGSTQWRNIMHQSKALNGGNNVVDDLISCLKDFVRNFIFSKLAKRSPTWLPTQLKFDGSGYPTENFMNTSESLDLIERLLTRTFWRRLYESKLTEDGGEAYAMPWNNTIAGLGLYMGAFRDQQSTTVRRVTSSELRSRVSRFNDFVNHSTGTNQYTYFTSKLDPCLGETFSLEAFLGEADYCIGLVARSIFEPPRAEMTYELTDTLTCLREKEFKYLPLWAGGCDDGTGGVYANPVPFAETDGFSAPGPSIHTGSAVPSEAPSIYSFPESTVHGASHKATEGFASEVVSIDSEALSEAGNVSLADPADFQKMDNELSLALNSSSDDVDDLFCDSDSDSNDTVVVGCADDSGISEFEELSLNDGLPTMGKSTTA